MEDANPEAPSKHRGLLVIIFVILLAVVLTAAIIWRVQRSLAPGYQEKKPAATTPLEGVPELRKEVILSGLDRVWDVGFLPDKTLIFTERAGTISKIANNRKVVLATVPKVFAQGEGGLLGLTVDPNFKENRYIYACYDTAQDIRVSRWKVNARATGLEDQKDIVTGVPVNTTTYPGRHSGCRPRFGADGYLWIGTGDVAISSNPQNPKSLGGKVLRVDRDGKAAPGNLSQPFDTRIYSYGHRNVQGLAMFDKPTHGLQGFSVEHGTGRDDEVTPLRSGNMGYDPLPPYNEDVPMTDKTTYPDAIDPLWQSGVPTIAPSGATILKGRHWRNWNGRIAVAVLKGKQLLLLELDEKGSLKSQEAVLKDEFGRLRTAVMGPSDNLYLSTDNGDNQDQIIRLVPEAPQP